MNSSDKLWDRNETVLLVKYCIDVKYGRISKKDAISELSIVLREYGKKKGYIIDSKYRNENGIRWQMAIMEKLLFNYHDNDVHSSILFEDVAKEYRENSDKLNTQLQTIHQVIENPPSRCWKDEILNCVLRLNKDYFTLNDMYTFEEELQTIHPANNNVKAKIRQQLQFLRNDGILDFVKDGEYQLRTNAKTSSDISTLFQKILDTYNEEKKELVDSSSVLYNIIVDEIPDLIYEKMNRQDLIIKGSMGKGRTTDYPWVAIMNSGVTSTAHDGIYITYLFKSDMSGFYLTLMQGITSYEIKYKKDQYKNAKIVAEYFRTQIEDLTTIKTYETDLNSKKGDLGYGYEQTVVLSRYYPSHNFGEKDILNDLTEMIVLYDAIVDHLNGMDYSWFIETIINSPDSYKENINNAISEIRKIIDPENTITNHNAILQEVVPTRSFIKNLEPPNHVKKKIDYIKKAKKDLTNGLKGEMLVLEYERVRLRDIGLTDSEEMVTWISKESDSYGYDIESVDILDDGTIVPIFIEVKSTSSKYDCDFFVSKNELETSKRIGDNYYVYRLYDIDSDNPKVYRKNGYIENNFIIDPVTYSARYKYK